jgi:hypothetical protein
MRDRRTSRRCAVRARSGVSLIVLVAAIAGCRSGEVAGSSGPAGGDGGAAGTSSGSSSGSGAVDANQGDSTSGVSSDSASDNGVEDASGVSGDSAGDSGVDDAEAAVSDGSGSGESGSTGTCGDSGASAASDGGKACGGPAAVSCDPFEWCEFPGGGCGGNGQWGQCLSSVNASASDCWSPVCGCDGRLYPNAEAAHSVGLGTTGSTSCVPGDGGVGSPCAVDANCQTGFKCCGGGAKEGPLKCTQPVSGACPMVP